MKKSIILVCLAMVLMLWIQPAQAAERPCQIVGDQVVGSAYTLDMGPNVWTLIFQAPIFGPCPGGGIEVWIQPQGEPDEEHLAGYLSYRINRDGCVMIEGFRFLLLWNNDLVYVPPARDLRLYNK